MNIRQPLSLKHPLVLAAGAAAAAAGAVLLVIGACLTFFPATWNLLLYPALLLVALLLFRPRLALNRYLCVSVLAVILIYWVLRNLPWYPFTLLAPH